MGFRVLESVRWGCRVVGVGSGHVVWVGRVRFRAWVQGYTKP